MDKRPEFREPLTDFQTKKTKYFSSLGIKLKEALELHKSFELLAKNDEGKKDWRNVSQHCLVVAARSRILSKLTGLSQETENDLVLAAGVHDFYKKRVIERAPSLGAMSIEDQIETDKEADAELTKAGFSQDIIDYVGADGSSPNAIYKVREILSKGEAVSEKEIAALVLHYADDFTRATNWAVQAETDAQGSKINDLNRRIEEARHKTKYKLVDEGGKKYFDGKTTLDTQEAVGEEVEKFLAMRISQIRGANIDPKDLPTIIDEEIKKEIERAAYSISVKTAEKSVEWEKRFEQVAVDCLKEALSVHDTLGKDGEEEIQKNQFGDTAMKADWECEEAVLNALKGLKIPIRVISEEHGKIDITQNPRFLGILDGIDGSSVYKKERGTGRYGTMFGIFKGTDPSYKDYLVSGIMEHATKRMFIAIKNKGGFVIEAGKKIPLRTSGNTVLNKDIKIYEDNSYEMTKKTYPQLTEGFNNKEYIRASCLCYADVASGAADLTLECTRKGNLEIATAFALITEAGGAMVDLNGNSIEDKKYLEFGQKEQLPIITAATQELATEFLARLKK